MESCCCHGELTEGVSAPRSRQTLIGFHMKGWEAGKQRHFLMLWVSMVTAKVALRTGHWVCWCLRSCGKFQNFCGRGNGVQRNTIADFHSISVSALWDEVSAASCWFDKLLLQPYILLAKRKEAEQTACWGKDCTDLTPAWSEIDLQSDLIRLFLTVLTLTNWLYYNLKHSTFDLFWG